MEVSLVNIGTSKGIRIPSSILKIFNNPKFFSLEIEGNKIILETKQKLRSDWEEKFKNSSEKLLIDDKLDFDDWDRLDD